MSLLPFIIRLFKGKCQIRSLGYSFLDCFLHFSIPSWPGSLLPWYCFLRPSTLSWRSLSSTRNQLPALTLSQPYSLQCCCSWIPSFQTLKLPFSPSSSLLLLCTELPNHLYLLHFTSFPPQSMSYALL